MSSFLHYVNMQCSIQSFTITLTEVKIISEGLEQHFFIFSFVMEGATKKGFKINNATDVNLQQKH